MWESANREAPQPLDMHLERWALRAARTLHADHLAHWLARRGVTLVAHRDALHLRGKHIHGVWDPILKRIEIWGCDEQRSDAELATTLGHELWHMLVTLDRVTVRATTAGEASARRFAAAWVGALGAAGVKRCATHLRTQASATEAAFVTAGLGL